jgi:hypothetical protein
MEKAVDRQRVLLRHLNPAAAASPAPHAISVRIPSFTLSLSLSLVLSDQIGRAGPTASAAVFLAPDLVLNDEGAVCAVCGCVAGKRVRGGGQRGVPPEAGLRRRRRHRRVSEIRLPALFCF